MIKKDAINLESEATRQQKTKETKSDYLFIIFAFSISYDQREKKRVLFLYPYISVLKSVL